MRRRDQLKRSMREAGLTSVALASLSGYTETSIRRFRCGVRPISNRAWRALKLAIDTAGSHGRSRISTDQRQRGNAGL